MKRSSAKISQAKALVRFSRSRAGSQAALQPGNPASALARQISTLGLAVGGSISERIQFDYGCPCFRAELFAEPLSERFALTFASDDPEYCGAGARHQG